MGMTFPRPEFLAVLAFALAACGCEKKSASTPANSSTGLAPAAQVVDSPAPPSSDPAGLRAPRSFGLDALRLSLEIADSPAEREKGLSGRQNLDWNRGMLFVFPDQGRRAFWMIDCFFDIDIAYLDPHGVVRDLYTMRAEPGVPPAQLTRYPSATADIQYALEVGRGWLASQGVQVGDTIPEVARHRTKE